MCVTACGEPAFLAKLHPKPDLSKSIFSFQCLSLFSSTLQCPALPMKQPLLQHPNLFSSSHSFTIASYCSLASSGPFKGDLQQSLPPSVTANRKLICGTELRPTRKVQTAAFSRCMSRKSDLSSLRSSCTSRWFENMQDFEYFVRRSYKLVPNPRLPLVYLNALYGLCYQLLHCHLALTGSDNILLNQDFFFVFCYFLNEALQTDGKDGTDDILPHIN